MTKPKTEADEPVRRKHRDDYADAFIPDPGSGPARFRDTLAEELGEDFVRAATTGEEQGEEAHEQEVDEEHGGPFVVTAAEAEFAHGPDASNPKSASREPFPTARGRSGS